MAGVLSFYDSSELEFIEDLNFLESFNYFANQFLMPIGGMMVAIFAGWFFKPDLALVEFSGIQFYIFQVWRFFIKFVSPVLVASVFIYQLAS